MPSFCDYVTLLSRYEPYPIEFPRDFGRHPDKEIEMWWFLSHLTDIASSRRFGLEVGVIRADLTRMCSNENQVVYSHSLAVSDVAADEYRFTLDYAIGAQIKASAPAERTFFLTAPGLFHFEQTGNVFTVWSTGQDKSQGHEGEVMYFNATLKDILGPLPMAQGGFAHATDDPALVAHADQLKMEGQGVLRMGNNEYFVRVEGFVQHLWHSDFKIPPKPGGWDWRYAQLSNGWAVDGTQWREADGSYNKHSYFNLIQPQPDGTSKNIYLSADKWTMTHGRPWTSPKTNTTYYTEVSLVRSGVIFGLFFFWQDKRFVRCFVIAVRAAMI